MKITRTNAIDKYHIVLEPGDELHRDCMWADFSLDNESYTISVVSDSGNFAYRWGPSKNESFKNLMSRIGSEYLLNKFADRTELDLKETIKKLKEYVDYHVESRKEKRSINKYLENLRVYSVGELIQEINDYCGDARIRERWAYESIVMDYPIQARVISQFFVKYLQPVLRGEVGLDGGMV